MAAEQKNSGTKLPHNLILEDRRRLTVSGARDMDSFDEQTIVLYTDLGELTVRGMDLHMNKLSLETGEVQVEGDIHSLQYTESKQSGQGLLGRLFKS